MKRKIPINPALFGDFNRGNRTKIATIYFWFRSVSSYDKENDIEYFMFPLNKPLSATFYNKKFGYSRQVIPRFIQTLLDNNLVVINMNARRYEFPTSFNDGEWILVDLNTLQELFDKYKTSDIINVLGYLRIKFNIFGDKHIFTYGELSEFLGYSSSSGIERVREILQLLQDDGYIEYRKCNGAECFYNYGQYQKLLKVVDL